MISSCKRHVGWPHAILVRQPAHTHVPAPKGFCAEPSFQNPQIPFVAAIETQYSTKLVNGNKTLTITGVQNSIHFSSISVLPVSVAFEGAIRCMGIYRRVRGLQSRALSKRTAKQTLLSKRTVKITNGSLNRHAACLARMAACIFGWSPALSPTPKAVATATFAGSAVSPAGSSICFSAARRVRRGSIPSARAFLGTRKSRPSFDGRAVSFKQSTATKIEILSSRGGAPIGLYTQAKHGSALCPREAKSARGAA